MEKKVLKQRLSTSKIDASEDEVDSFLRTIKAVPTDGEIESFLKTIKAVPSDQEIDEFLLSIKAQDAEGKPIKYADGKPCDFIGSQTSPFAKETLAQLKKSGSVTQGLNNY